MEKDNNNQNENINSELDSELFEDDINFRSATKLQIDLLRDIQENSNIIKRQSDTALTPRRNHSVIKEVALLLHYNVFRHHNKEKTRMRYVELGKRKILVQSIKVASLDDVSKILKGQSANINDSSFDVNCLPSYLPAPITKDYLYIALSSPRPSKNFVIDNNYVIEFDWNTFFSIYGVKNEYKDRVHVSNRLEELTTVHISHNFDKDRLKSRFWYCNKIITDLSKHGGVQLYFDSFRRDYESGLLFTVPLNEYLSLNNPFSKDLFVLAFCFTNQRTDNYCEFNITLRDLLIRIGKPDVVSFRPSHIKRFFSNILVPSLNDLIRKDYFYITYDSKESFDINNIVLDTVITFIKGSARMSLYTKNFMESPASKLRINESQ